MSMLPVVVSGLDPEFLRKSDQKYEVIGRDIFQRPRSIVYIMFRSEVIRH